MAYSKQLYDLNGEKFYPKTITDSVFDGNGVPLTSKIQDIDEEVSKLNRIKFTELVDAGQIVLEQGSIGAAGENITSPIRLRVKDAIPTSVGGFSIPDGYIVQAVFYYSEWTDSSTYTYSTFVSKGTKSVTFDTAYNYVRPIFKKADDSNIVPEDIENALPLVSKKIDSLGQYVEDDEYVRVITDAEGRILFGITAEGEVKWEKGIPAPIKDKLDELSQDIASKRSSGFTNDIFVAAHNAPDGDKANADIVCDGVDDGSDITAALLLGGENAKVHLSQGTFVIDTFLRYGIQSSQYIGIRMPYYDGNAFAVTISGNGCRGTDATEISVSASAWDSLSADEQPVLFGFAPLAGYNVMNLDNFKITLPDNQHKIICIDNEYLGGGDIHHISMMAHSNNSLEQAPVEGCVGFRSWRGSDTGTIHITKNIVCIGFREAFQIGAEHHVLINCGGRWNYYCWTFGNYDYHAGYNIHPIVLINCSDEHSLKYPLFANNGKADGSNVGMQSVTFIGFNLEPLASLAGVTPERAKEVSPGSWCGVVEYTSDGGYYNSLTERFWESGSGHNFRTRNLTHAMGGSTDVRLSYSPTYMQHFYDTTISKLLTYDGSKWVDCNGTEV